MKLLPLLAVMIGFLPATTHAQVLWQNVAVGMTPDEVLKAQPTSRRAPSPEHLGNGATCDVSIPDYAIASDTYRACFFFDGGKLIQVMLTAEGEPSEAQFRSIVTLLRAKYGKELSLERTSLGLDADWLIASGVNISVLYYGKYGNILNINYQVRMARDSKGL